MPFPKVLEQSEHKMIWMQQAVSVFRVDNQRVTLP